MAGNNGTAHAADVPKEADAPVGPLDLDDLAYERVPVRVRINGEPKVFDAWVAGLGCPGTVKAEYARKYRAMVVSTDAPGAAYHEYLIDTLRIAMPDMSYPDAELLAGDVGRAERILLHLRWHKPPEPDADPEAMAKGSPSTTPLSLATSSDASAASDRTDAAG